MQIKARNKRKMKHEEKGKPTKKKNDTEWTEGIGINNNDNIYPVIPCNAILLMASEERTGIFCIFHKLWIIFSNNWSVYFGGYCVYCILINVYVN